MIDAIPDWAGQRACELLNASGNILYIWPQHNTHHAVRTVAKLLMQHEQPPTDPLLLEARKIVAEQNREAEFHRFAAAVENGEHDAGTEMCFALAALRRGIEIGKETAP